MAFPTEWSYRKSFTYSRASGAVTNYQMKILVGESAGATGEEVDCGGLCNTDFSDLRFTNAAGTLLDYWIESVSGTTPNQLATVWVECDSIETSATTFYMYYGSAGAASASSGADTFLLFDDFADESMSTALWDAVNSATIVETGTEITITSSSGAWRGMTSDASFASGKRFRASASMKVAGETYNNFGFGATCDPNINCVDFYGGYDVGTSQKLRTAKASAYTEGSNLTGDLNTHLYEITWESTACKGYIDGVLEETITTNIPIVDLKVNFGVYPTTGELKAGWVFVGSLVASEPAFGSWGSLELTGWSYRKSFALSRASGAVTDYQMKVLVGESAGATGEEVDCGGLCNTDFSDLRFTNAAGTLLDYWIESVSGTTPNQLATVWVECDSIETSATTFYMYYGNAGASAVSSGANTFIFFDDFDGVAIDSSKWDDNSENSGTITVSGGTCLLSVAGATDRGKITSKTNFGLSTALRASVRHKKDTSNNNLRLGYIYDTPSANRVSHYFNGTGAVTSQWSTIKAGAATATNENPFTSEVYSIVDWIRTSSSEVKYIFDGTLKATHTTNIPLGDYPLVFDIDNDNVSTRYCELKFALVRQYVANEPEWGAWGSLELTGWSYRKSFALSRASGAVTNYQMKVLVGESAGATGEEVDCGGLCNTDFSDLRFTNATGTLLDYWIESVSGATPNQLATVWVECDSIGTGATTFYMYYGNAEASAVSSGDDTFLFFDDFSGDLSKWSGDTAAASITGGICTLAGGGGDQAIHSPAYAGDIAFRTRTQLYNGDYSQIGLSDNPTNIDYALLFHSSARANHSAHATSKAGSAADFSTAPLGFGAYHIYDITRYLSGADTVRSFTDGTQNGIGDTTHVPTVSLTAMLRAVGTGPTVLTDWVLIRQYVEGEPAWGAWGGQESFSGGIIIPILFSQYRRRWAA